MEKKLIQRVANSVEYISEFRMIGYQKLAEEM